MDRKVAKELLHVRDWLDRASEIVARGHEMYTTDELLQEAGDSLMMKLGEASGRLARTGVEPPSGVAWADAIANRNWLIHQYDEIDRALTIGDAVSRPWARGEPPWGRCSSRRRPRWRRPMPPQARDMSDHTGPRTGEGTRTLTPFGTGT